MDESGNPMNGLFCFEHEAYDVDQDQDINEFLSRVPASIEEFLTQI